MQSLVIEKAREARVFPLKFKKEGVKIIVKCIVIIIYCKYIVKCIVTLMPIFIIFIFYIVFLIFWRRKLA